MEIKLNLQAWFFNELKIRCLIILILLFSVLFLNAQINLNSRIITAKEKEGLSFAHIFLKSTQDGTTSDAEGWFKLQCHNNDTIIIKCIGYQTNVLLASDVNLRNVIEMVEDTIQLNEITIHAESVYRMLIRVRDSTYKYFPESLQGICYRHDKLSLNEKTERDVNSEILFKTERRNGGYNNINYWLKDINSFNNNSDQKQPHISYENTIPLYGIVINPLLPLSLRLNSKKELAKARYSIISESDSTIIIKAIIEKPSNRKVTEGIFKISKKTWLMEKAEYNGDYENDPIAGSGLCQHQTNIRFIYECLDDIFILKTFTLKWLFSHRKYEPANLWEYSVEMNIVPTKEDIHFQNLEKLRRTDYLLYKKE